MSNRRKTHLDAVERRLTGPKRIGLFGHRDVGKTTLLAMLYRQGSTGRIGDVRLAAADPPTAEYLAEKIAQIESGEPPVGTLAETDLRLRLYHGDARFDLLMKDYQGEHLTLGSDEPILRFFADCDAVLFCLDPEASARSEDRRRRQQEIENLLERYIESSPDGKADRPVALVLTKFDRVMTRAGIGFDGVERLVQERYGMTRHAFARHAPHGAIFAVSSYGLGAVDGRPPVELEPIGLEGPLAWIAGRLEMIDRDQLDWLWDLAPRDVPRLARAVSAFEKRYPDSPLARDYRARLKEAAGSRNRRVLISAAAGLALFTGGLAGYDAWGFQNALEFEKDPARPPAAVERRWEEFLTWHPSFSYFWPNRAELAKRRHVEWRIKSEERKVAVGTVDPSRSRRLDAIKEEYPALASAVAKVETARDLARHDASWRELLADAAASGDEPETVIPRVRNFLKEFPESARKSEAIDILEGLKQRIVSRKSSQERRLVDDLARSARLPNADLEDLTAQASRFLSNYPESSYRSEVEGLLAGFEKTLDDRDIEIARKYGRDFPGRYQTRITKFEDYLRKHRAGGRYISEASEAKERILNEWDVETYRVAQELSVRHPDDVSGIAQGLREYAQLHPQGRYVKAAKEYLAWYEKVSVPGKYLVTLLRGEFDQDIGKYFAGGAPDLSVEIEIAGVIHGPSSIVKNSRKPIWSYAFPKPIVWKLNDPVSIRVIDNDWSATPVWILNSRKDDPLAIRLLNGVVKPAAGGPTKIAFASDFKIPELPRPE